MSNTTAVSTLAFFFGEMSIKRRTETRVTQCSRSTTTPDILTSMDLGKRTIVWSSNKIIFRLLLFHHESYTVVVDALY